MSVCDRLREVAYTGPQEDNLEIRRVFRRKKPSIFGTLAVRVTENSTNHTRTGQSGPSRPSRPAA